MKCCFRLCGRQSQVCSWLSIFRLLPSHCQGIFNLFLATAVVLATVSGNLAAVLIWNRTGRSSPGCYPDNMGTHQVRGLVRTGSLLHFTVPTTLAAIQYLNSHNLGTWCIHEMCRLMPYFISHSPICNRINIHWVAVKLRKISRQNDLVSIITQWLFIRLQIGEREMKVHIKLHISRIDFVTIWWELHNVHPARNVKLWGVGVVWKRVATVRFRAGSGHQPELRISTRWYHFPAVSLST
jgi:hypothetical protein